MNARRVLQASFTIVVLALALPYACAPIYRFPEPTVFSGSTFRNPYADLGGVWQRANFHAHGRAWMGLTNGQQSDEEVAQRYRDLGYSVPGVSDYQHIAAQHGVDTFPLYEHGYNLWKHHQVAIGARSVEWMDFPFWQSRSHQQFIIDRVKQKAELVALAHPASRDAYTEDDLQYLTGYDLIEIVNGPFVQDAAWDAALSSGHPVGAVANDDTHDLTDSRRTAVGWNMIDAATPSVADITDALRLGRSYAVLRTGAIGAANETVLERVEVQGNLLTVSVNGVPSTFTFVGQNGAIRKAVKESNAATYELTDADTYVRTVIVSPQTVLYLNPVIRYDGTQVPVPVATVNVAGTWMFRGGIVLAGLLCVVAYSRRRTAMAVNPGTVLADAKRNTA